MFSLLSHDADVRLRFSSSQQQVTFKGKKLKLGPAIMKERSSRESGFQGSSLFRCLCVPPCRTLQKLEPYEMNPLLVESLFGTK